VSNPQPPVLLIGLDAADLDLMRRLCAAGEMPALSSLMDRGCFGALEGNAARFAGGVWPTFYRGRDVGWHGLYHNKLWRQERMCCELADESWFPEPPFWELLDRERLRMAVLDVPMTVASPKPLNGVHLAGWGTHDVITRGAWPSGLWQELTREFGAPAMPAELFGPQSAGTLRRLTARLLDSTDQMSRIGASLLARERWDLFLIVFGATHRGGHYLWDLSQLDPTALRSEARRELEDALTKVYRACDQGVKRLLDRAPPDSRVMVFALHGMGRNTTWADRTPEILHRIQAGGSNGAPKGGALYRLKRMIPWPLIRPITTRLPQSIQSRLVKLWSRRMFDWSATRAFPLPMDHAGYLRINLRGREPEGTVSPGAEYDALCRELAEGFLSFRDLETGEPIARRVHRLDELAPPGAPGRDRLPDLVIEWAGVSPTDSRGIVSGSYSEMRWSPPDRLPSGRAGNHRSHGWFVGAGEGIAPGTRADGYQIVDLVPTIFRWLGADQAAGFQGGPIGELCR
jgi:predicted AlkP superfamily phosphohydrolase/phosphomutase